MNSFKFKSELINKNEHHTKNLIFCKGKHKYKGPKFWCKRIPSPLQVLKDSISKAKQQWGYKIDEQENIHN